MPEMPEWVSNIGGWLVAVIIAIIAWFPKKGSLEHQMIDQLQERVASLETGSEQQSKRVDYLEDALIWYRRRDVAWERRESVLMSVAERGAFPPWPAREGILAEVRYD